MSAILKSPVLLSQRLDLNTSPLAPAAEATPKDTLRAELEASIRAELQAEFDARLDEAREDARSEGYKEGLSTGHEEGKTTAMEAFRKKQALMDQLLEQAEARVDEWLNTVTTQATDLARLALCELLGEQALNTSLLEHLIQKMTSHLRPADVLQVRLHPTDGAVLRAAMRQSTDSQIGSAVLTKLTDDVSLEAGGVVVETSRGEYIATLDVLLRKLLTLVDEQRQASTTGGAVFHALRA